MYVTNWQGGERDIPRGYESWLDYWKKNTGTSNPCCCVKGCSKMATDGAHVYRSGIVDRKIYIVPMCHEHNMQRGSELEIKDSTKLVPVNK